MGHRDREVTRRGCSGSSVAVTVGGLGWSSRGTATTTCPHADGGASTPDGEVGTTCSTWSDSSRPGRGTRRRSVPSASAAALPGGNTTIADRAIVARCSAFRGAARNSGASPAPD